MLEITIKIPGQRATTTQQPESHFFATNRDDLLLAELVAALEPGAVVSKQYRTFELEVRRIA